MLVVYFYYHNMCWHANISNVNIRYTRFHCTTLCLKACDAKYIQSYSDWFMEIFALLAHLIFKVRI